jgi:iron-sulfur cluster repair protein YtfE (RIC family)
MEKLNRITLLDDTKRPKAPKIDGLSPQQRAQGRRLGWFHNMHRAQLDEVRAAMEQLDVEGLRDKVAALAISANFRMFGNLCGEECMMLSGHHGIEDAHVFPLLHAAGSNGLRKVVERLMAEHLVVHELIEELEAAAHVLVSAPTEENFTLAKVAFSDLEKCVKSHFGYEETELEEALGVIDVGI